jgi:hypothetical protein
METRRGDEVLFREVQEFGKLQKGIVVPACIGAWLALLKEIIDSRKEGQKRRLNVLIIFRWILSGLALPLLYFTAKLTVEVYPDGIYYRFSPIHLNWHCIPFSDIETAEARTYRPLLEYGGWGIRYGLKGKAYNASGKRGVQLRLKNGKRILLGSQDADALAAAISDAMRGREA